MLPSIRPASALRRAAGIVSAEPQPESRTPVRSASFWQIVFAVIGAALFVLTLIVVVRIVIANAA